MTKRNLRYAVSFALLAALMFLLLIWNINSGSVRLSVPEVFKILFQRTGDETFYHIIWDIRLPRILERCRCPVFSSRLFLQTP